MTFTNKTDQTRLERSKRPWPRPLRNRADSAVDPDEALFTGLFRRLLLWYTSLLAVLVLGLGLGTGATVPWLVVVSSQRNLAGPVARLAATWSALPGQACPLTLPGRGYLLACYDARGKLIKAYGIHTDAEAHFLDNTLALAALHNGPGSQDSLDESGTREVAFEFVFLNSARPGIVRQAMVVRDSRNQILGVVQLGTTPDETLARRGEIVSLFIVAILLALLICVPLGGWYLASKALLPTHLAFQRQREFIANVSHELRTPLALLRANAEVLLRGRVRLNEEDAELLEDIAAEAIYMDKMTSNMLLLAQMDARQMHLELEILNLSEITQSVARRAQTFASQQGITLDCQEEEPAHVLGDRVLLEQATFILLDNALKYNQPGGRVSIRTFQEEKYTCLRVSDTGIGIPAQELERLGERFYRVDKARSRQEGSHGLGLAIARGIVAAHHGTLTLTSELGQSTTATLLLPREQKHLPVKEQSKPVRVPES